MSVGEFELIGRLRAKIAKRLPVVVGIGDDAAVLKTGPRTLITTDMLIEDRHFRLRDAEPEEIGWKAMAVNLSDIAAMGGKPTAAVVALGLPRSFSAGKVERLYRGLLGAAERFGVVVAGGDTNASDKVVIAVTLLGEAPKRPILRSGAKIGDAVWVTGWLGNSLKSGRHLRFVPRVREAQWLVSNVRIHAMMDLSDGLSSDLRRMADESVKGFRIEASRIPAAQGANLSGTLNDGEDFELLFTLSPSESLKLERLKKPVPMHRIGTVVARKKGITLVDEKGRQKPLPEKGYDHFRN